MSTGSPHPQDLATLASSLREYLSRSPAAPNDSPLPSDGMLQELLERLEGLTSETEPAPSSNMLPDGGGELICQQIDRQLARWQAEIVAAYRQTAWDDAAAQIASLDRLSEQLRTRENHLESLQQRLEDRLSAALEREARTERQRTTLAAKLRALKAENLQLIDQYRQQRDVELREQILQEADAVQAEMLSSREAADAARAELEEKSRDLEQARQQCSDLQGELETLQSLGEIELSEQGQAVLELQQQLQELRGELEQSHSALRDKETALEALESTIPGLNEQIEDLEKSQLTQLETNEELESTRRELEETRNRLEELEFERDERASSDSLGEEQSQELQQRIESLEEQLEQTRQALEQAEVALADSRENQSLDDSPAAAEELEQLRLELEQLRTENQRLSEENAELYVDRSGGVTSVSFDHESLSWEERKQLIMRQLEAEGDEEHLSDEQQVNRIEVERVLASTEKEIARRDQQIEELQSIIEQQSDTRQGVAIGAAAIAQMLDSDDLIMQEREKLKTIQQEWEEKLRKAEIDLSMERAKLARERTQLEAEREEWQQKRTVPAESPPEAGQGRTRKWLEHLGLKDENQGYA